MRKLGYGSEAQRINQTCAHLMFFQDFHRRRHQVLFSLFSSFETALPSRLPEGLVVVCLVSVCRGVGRGLASCPGRLLCRDVVPLLSGGHGRRCAQERYPLSVDVSDAVPMAFFLKWVILFPLSLVSKLKQQRRKGNKGRGFLCLLLQFFL